MTKPENEKVHKVEPHSLEKNSNIGKQYIIIGFILNVSVLEFYDLFEKYQNEWSNLIRAYDNKYDDLFLQWKTERVVLWGSP